MVVFKITLERVVIQTSTNHLRSNESKFSSLFTPFLAASVTAIILNQNCKLCMHAKLY